MYLKDLNNFSVTNSTKATQDSAGQQINTTYIKNLSASGKTITYTKGDGTTGTITTQDTNTTYSTGTASALGLTKLYTGTGTATDGTMTQNAIKSALDGKANSSHGKHVPDNCTSITDWNSATTTGWYMSDGGANAPTTGWYFGEVVAHNTNYLIQTVYQFTASSDAKAIPKYIRAKMNGTWGAWTNVTVAKAVPSNAVFTDTNTWRGVQDNLTSTATDQSLSANQGKVLKGLIDEKANSSHTHSYLPLSGGTLSGNIAINTDSKLEWNRNTDYARISFKNTGDDDSDSYMHFLTGDNGNEYFKFSSLSGSTTTDLLTIKTDHLRYKGNAVYHAGNKPTASDIGASASSHTHNYAGSSSVGGSANTSVKLHTARTINGTNFDGSANITTANWGTARKINNISVNGSADVKLPLDYYTCSVSDNNTNLYHHILASGQCTGDYTDKSITVVLVNHYNASGFGIAKITLRTNQASAGSTASGEIQWLVRSGFSANQLCFNIRNTAKDTYMDVFYKSSGTYNSLTWYVLSEGARGNHSGQWTKYNTNASGTNAYTEANMKALRSYTSTLQSAGDYGHTNSANTLATARTINGTSFNGSANITTANWGTARNITIGNTTKSVNGSGNVSWTLAEIGASPTSHNHGLLHDNFTVEVANTTTDSGWSMINSNYNGHILKSIRSNASAPAWLQPNYSAGIAFGGSDTKGVMSVAYNSPSVRFAGGNGTKPVWYFTLTGTSGKSYNMDSLATKTEVEELRTLINSAKSGLANAITNKGVSATSSDSFDTLISKVSQIDVGAKFT